MFTLFFIVLAAVGAHRHHEHQKRIHEEHAMVLAGRCQPAPPSYDHHHRLQPTVCLHRPGSEHHHQHHQG